VEFKPEIKPQRILPPLCQSGKYLRAAGTVVVTDFDAARINKTYSRYRTPATAMKIATQS
jgi:hypothetical protein